MLRSFKCNIESINLGHPTRISDVDKSLRMSHTAVNWVLESIKFYNDDEIRGRIEESIMAYTQLHVLINLPLFAVP